LSEGPFALGCGAYAKGFKHLGIDKIHVLHLDRHQGKTILPIFPPDVEFVCLPVRHSRQAMFAVASYLKHHQPDLLYSMPLHVNLAAILGRQLAPSVKTKLLIGERSTTSHKVFVQYAKKLSWRMMPALERMLYPRASGIVCNSQEVVDDLLQNIRLRIPHDRLAVIPPAIDLEGVARWKNEPVCHPWFERKEHPVIMTVARLSPEKNLPLLIEAFARVKEQIDCRLLILGEGDERNALQAMIDQKGLTQYIDLLGQVVNPWAYMARADLFVLPSTEEAFGRVLVEAMVCGLPVVATDAIGGGPRMILGDSCYGKLIPNDNLDQLVDAVYSILQNPRLAQELREQGAIRASISEPAHVAQKLLDFAATLKK
jgi:glycosyltransferase involved in cell wall biosynthesis